MRDLAEDFGSFGKILGWYRGPRPVIYATNPEFLKEFLIKESETYIDRPMLDRSDNVPHLIMLKGRRSVVASSNFRRWLIEIQETDSLEFAGLKLSLSCYDYVGH